MVQNHEVRLTGNHQQLASMLRLIVRRIALAVITLLIAVVTVFTVTEILPGDIATAYLGREATPQRLAEFRVKMGLDKPAPQRFLSWGRNLLRGNLGTSYGKRMPVSQLLKYRFRNSLMLVFGIAVISIPLAILLGLIAALSRYQVVETLISSIAVSIMSVPAFVTAILITFIVSIKLQLLPAITDVTADAPISELLPSTVLPSFTLVVIALAPVLMMVKTSVKNVMKSDYVQMAQLRGLPYFRIIWRYVLPNAMLPTVQIVTLIISSFLAGLVIIETIFNYPGLGTLTISAIRDRDVPLIQGVSLLLAGICISLNLGADILTVVLNPRVKSKMV